MAPANPHRDRFEENLKEIRSVAAPPRFFWSDDRVVLEIDCGGTDAESAGQSAIEIIIGQANYASSDITG